MKHKSENKSLFEAASQNAAESLYLIFRISVGFLFFVHGMQKLFGWFGGSAVSTINIYWFAGLIEAIVGLFVILGLFTRPAAILGGITMISALIIAHFPKGFNIITNRGEAAFLFLLAFLVLFMYGSKKWGLEKLLFKKEYF